MNKVHQSLHDLEAQLIEINGLMSALQQILPDGAAHTSVTNALDDRLQKLHRQFTEHWQILMERQDMDFSELVQTLVAE
jgi:hypothetical protein